MKFSYSAIVTAATAATLLTFATPAFAQSAAVPMQLGAPTTTGTTAMTPRMARMAKVNANRGMAYQKMLVNTANAWIKNWMNRDKNLMARIAKQTAKGIDTTAAQATVTDLETQISTAQGLVTQMQATTDRTQLMALRKQLQSIRKVAAQDINAANRALAKGRKPKAMTAMNAGQ